MSKKQCVYKGRKQECVTPKNGNTEWVILESGEAVRISEVEMIEEKEVLNNE